MNMHTQIPCSPALREYTTLLWELEGNLNSRETILPVGIVEVLFNLSKPISALLPGKKTIDRAPNCFIQGVHTRALRVHYQGKQHLFGIRLRPHAVRSWLGVLPSECSNTAIDLTLIRPQFQELWEQLVEAPSFPQRVKLVERHLQPIMKKDCIRTQKLSDWFLQRNGIGHPGADAALNQPFDSVAQLAEAVRFSPRHLNRKSRELFGLSAQELVRYKKYLRAIELIHQGSHSLTAIAHLSGFFDQSHFIRVFRSYAEMPPSQYLQQRGSLPGHLFS